jgi:hypothetical protein
MMRTSTYIFVSLALALTLAGAPSRARAADGTVAGSDEATEPLAVPVPAAGAAASTGVFLPFSQSAAVAAQGAYVTSVGGYDSARHTKSFEASAEVRLWGPIAIRGGAVYTGATATLRPSFGARARLLDERRQGVDAGVGIFYRPEGLTEAEGEIETLVAVGRHVGASYLLGNLLYGQDPEGNERDGEIRLAALHPVGSRLLVGFDGRLRFDLGSQQAKLAAHQEPRMDALVGPSATALLGPIALSVQGGGSAVQFPQQSKTYGLFAMCGMGTAF